MCHIDNLIIKTKDGEIVTIEGIDDEVIIKPRGTAYTIIGIVILVLIIGISIFFIIKRAYRYY